MSGGANIFTLQSSEIAQRWDEIKPFVDEVLPPEWSAEEAKEMLMDRKAQLWGLRTGSIIHGIWITKIENTKTACWGLVWLCAGNLEAVKEDALRVFRVYIEPWFEMKGCTSIHIVGRRGWARILPDYEERSVVLVKCL